LELYSQKRGAPAFCVDHLILYTHPMAQQRHLAQIADTGYQITDDLRALRLAVHPEPVCQPYSGPRIVLGLTPRFSANVPESDVLSDHEDSEEQDEAGHRSPTL
jgi:hypothetical protein